jgi:hypothetical protein
MRIEEYWFGFVVTDENGVSLSQAFDTEIQANMFIYEYSQAMEELLRDAK